MILDRFKNAFFEKFEGSSALVLSPSNRRYLSGFSSSDGAVLVTPKNSYLIVDFRYYEMAKKKNTPFNVVLAEKPILSVAKELISDEKVESVVIEDHFVTVSQNERIKTIFDKQEVLYFDTFLEELRSIKTDEEIFKIKASQELTDACFSHILKALNKNLTENDVAVEIDSFLKRNGAEDVAFKTICVSGKKSALPHGEPSSVKLSGNSFLTMDFGAKLDGYASDMTRTVVIGKADDEMKFIYDTVLKAQLSALDCIKAGVMGSTVDAAARNVIASAGYGNSFGHSTGHGLGIDVHEPPSFSPRYDKPIPKNSVLSVEPGIYIEGKYGVRIEDIVVVSEASAINLTKSDKKLIEIV